MTPSPAATDDAATDTCARSAPAAHRWVSLSWAAPGVLLLDTPAWCMFFDDPDLAGRAAARLLFPALLGRAQGEC